MGKWERWHNAARRAPGCRIYWLDGQKFRTNLIVFFFDIPLRRETATKTALLAEVLKQGCAAYPTPQALARHAEELYGAILDISVVKKGERQLLLFSMQTLKTVDLEEAVAFLRALFAEPLLHKGAFSEKIVARQKRILRERLESLADDKKAYARKRALEETAKGTAFGISADGEVADLEKIDAQELYAFYRNLMKHAAARVLFCGERQDRAKLFPLRRDFTDRMENRKRETPFLAPTEPHFIHERMELTQARLVLGFSGDTQTPARQAALRLLAQVLGGDADAMLFQELREQEGLCYDVKADLLPLSPYLFVQAGIAQADAPQACRLMLDCVDRLRRERLSAARIQQAKDAILQRWEGLADDPWAMTDFFANQILQNRPLSLEKFLRQIGRVDAEDIRRAAMRLECRAIYLLDAQEKEAGNGKGNRK